MEQWVYVVGLVLGTFAIVAACGVWVRKQLFGAGGTVLSLVGLILVGLSVWKSVEISVTEGTVSVRLERLEQDLAEVTGANLAMAQELEKVANALTTTKQQFVQLTHVLENRGTLAPEVSRELRTPVDRLPTLDRARLNSAIEILRRRRPDGVRDNP